MPATPAPSAPTAFYEVADDGSLHSTAAATSPWNPAQQHGGPPSALLARAIEKCEPRADLAVSRISVDFLGAIPQGRMDVAASVIRPGRRIELVEAVLTFGGRPSVVARAWRTQTGDAGAPAIGLQNFLLPAVPGPQPQRYFDGVDPDWGYGRAIEWRFVEGSFYELGPAKVWARPLIPLVAGEEITSLQRILVVADSTNGISGSLPFAEWLYVPPTLTVTVYRESTDEWIYLDARTAIHPGGRGLAHADLADRDGHLGVATQPLFLQRR